MEKIFFQFIINSENIFNSIKIYLIFFYHFTINSTQLNTKNVNFLIKKMKIKKFEYLQNLFNIKSKYH